MSSQINFLISQGLQYLKNGNLNSAELLLRQVLKIASKNHDALRLLSVIASHNREHSLAYDLINRAIASNPKNGIAYSNRGNILLALGRPFDAVAEHKKSIHLMPNYAEAYSNLGNALQELGEFNEAIDAYRKALEIEPNNAEFICNIGNAFWASNLFTDAIKAYSDAIQLQPADPAANFYLAQLYLLLGNFRDGWLRYESRWYVNECQSMPLSTSKPLWKGEAFDGCLYVWAEQGIGDQILHSSMLEGLSSYPQKKIVSVEKKLVNIFQRSFPGIDFIDKGTLLPETEYDEQLPMASLGQFLRKDISSFAKISKPYLKANPLLNIKVNSEKKIVCGVSWSSTNAFIGRHKSMALMDLSSIFQLRDIEFVNLQYGDTKKEIDMAKEKLDIEIFNKDGIDLYNDIDSMLGLIEACDIVITTSNSTAHLSGALGKETILLLPFSLGKFWYWHELNGVSLWYPSVRVFKQLKQGDWSDPVLRARSYLEKRFAF